MLANFSEHVGDSGSEQSKLCHVNARVQDLMTTELEGKAGPFGPFPFSALFRTGHMHKTCPSCVLENDFHFCVRIIEVSRSLPVTLQKASCSYPPWAHSAGGVMLIILTPDSVGKVECSTEANLEMLGSDVWLRSEPRQPVV